MKESRGVRRDSYSVCCATRLERRGLPIWSLTSKVFWKAIALTSSPYSIAFAIAAACRSRARIRLSACWNSTTSFPLSRAGASDMLSDAEFTALKSFWIWAALKERWEYVRDWEEHKRKAMEKFEKYATEKGRRIETGYKPQPLKAWIQ